MNPECRPPVTVQLPYPALQSKTGNPDQPPGLLSRPVVYHPQSRHSNQLPACLPAKSVAAAVVAVALKPPVAAAAVVRAAVVVVQAAAVVLELVVVLELAAVLELHVAVVPVVVAVAVSVAVPQHIVPW